MTSQDQQLLLQLGEIPQYPYVNHPFEVEIFLVNEKTQLKTNVDASIHCQLFYDEKPLVACDSSLLVIEEPTSEIKITRNGVVIIRFRLTDVSMNHDNRKFVLKFSGTSTYGLINPVISTPMLCIQHRLIIKDMHENPIVWYKDEGGREKSIDMSVSLFDCNGNRVLNRRIHLKLTLKYENGQDVPKQDILKLNPDSRLFIDEVSGEAVLRFRIEEVSRSHQKQLFRILVSPDSVHYPLTSDISSHLSVPIEVRSKRNKKDKMSQDMDMSEKRQRIDFGDPYGSMPMSILPSLGSVISSTDGTINSSNLYVNNLTASDRLDLSLDTSGTLLGNSSFMQSSLSSSTTNINNVHHHNQLLNSSQINSQMIHLTQSALWTIIQWTNLVINSIPDLHWRCIGYERSINGDNDLNRPLYNIPNPNEILTMISEEYGRKARNSLEILYEELIQKNVLEQLAQTQIQSNQHSSLIIDENGNSAAYGSLNSTGLCSSYTTGSSGNSTGTTNNNSMDNDMGGVSMGYGTSMPQLLQSQTSSSNSSNGSLNFDRPLLRTSKSVQSASGTNTSLTSSSSSHHGNNNNNNSNSSSTPAITKHSSNNNNQSSGLVQNSLNPLLEDGDVGFSPIPSQSLTDQLNLDKLNMDKPTSGISRGQLGRSYSSGYAYTQQPLGGLDVKGSGAGGGTGVTPLLSRSSTMEILEDFNMDAYEYAANVEDTQYASSGVFFVSVKPYISPMNAKQYGLPAYDRNKNLLGFYRDESDTFGSHVNLRLLKSSECPELNDDDMISLKNELVEGLRDDEMSNADATHAFILTTELFYNNIKDMIDYAFLRSWGLSG